MDLWNGGPGGQSSSTTALPFVPGEILVGFEGDLASSFRQQGAAANLAAAHQLTAVEGLANLEMVMDAAAAPSDMDTLATRWQLSPGADLMETISRLKNTPGVAYAEPNYLVSMDAVPNDPKFAELWGLNNTGQSGGKIRAVHRQLSSARTAACL